VLLGMRSSVFGRPGTRLQIPVRSNGIPLARRALVGKLRAHGIPVDYWVINDAKQAAALLELGAAGIVTDDVRTMAKLFATRAETRAWRDRHPHLL
jgi:glycerophosphoryl diester phosphodiesterase